MAIFMRNVSWNVDDKLVTEQLANYLHSPHFQHLHPTRMNFHVFLHPDKRKLHRHNGTGILTLPDEETANLFLRVYGSLSSQIPISMDRKVINFQKSTRKQIRRDVQEKIMLPYQEPWVVEMRHRRVQSLNKGRVDFKALQFGWECRDYVFSIESEKDFSFHNEPSPYLSFEEDRRELQIKFMHDAETYIIAMNYSHFREIYINHYLEKDPVILFSLSVPPTYLRQKLVQIPNTPKYERLPFLPISDHKRVAPFASLAIRVVCTSLAGLHEFQRLCSVAQLRKISNIEYPVERREFFSALALEKLDKFLRALNWSVAFQILGLLYGLVLDVKEILELMGPIVKLCHDHGETFVSTLLRKFIPRANQLYFEEEVDGKTVLQCFRDTEAEMAKSPTLATLKPTEGSIYDAYHIIITPTTMSFSGPHPERSNRVIRAYDSTHHESFLRVNFWDEAKLQYRFDRDIDGPGFIRSRVGSHLLNGLLVAGRTFKFLAYSQSALKEHSVWFVKTFRNSRDNTIVGARSIIQSLGTFDKVDERLMYCPARYAARISQAFTATDSVEVEVEEVLRIKDIETADKKYQFTDGVGTISKELADEINAQLKKNSRRRGRLAKSLKPSAYQIRFRGVKGMVSIDYKLRGLTMCIRPSMIKFEADGWNHIEIARAFDRPTPYYLNRPLIMLFEGLGVPYEVFEKYQRRAVKETNQARDSLSNAASGLFDRYGLGAAFRISSVLLNLQKLGFTHIPDSEFYKKMVDDAIHHVLRDLKNHARIPIPGAWTLVGVADVHRYLAPNEIFACVKPVNSRTIYLEGPILISRSPTIHPGDAMIVHAIGRPPPGNCFHAEPLTNTVVFSVQGERPIPSCLGGGDLDGDVYNLIPLNDLPEFTPTESYQPANYLPSERMVLDRPSNMADVAEFVMEYINSDVVGIIATNWLLIADQSPQHITDPRCMTLANLHSDAVDYPKSGRSVALDRIPKPELRIKPDWHAPETVDITSGDFYESPRAIGRLFRDIDLPVEQTMHETRTRTRPRAAGPKKLEAGIDDIEKSMRKFNMEDHGHNIVFAVVEEYVEEFIDTRSPSEDEEEMMLRLFEDFASTLKSHCITHTLSHAKTGQLSEAEAVVGTIVQRTSQRRKRKDMMAKLREDTDILVRGIREELSGGDDIGNEKYLERSWVAWKLALIKKESKEFGADAFWWVALGAVFDAIREIEDSMK